MHTNTYLLAKSRAVKRGKRDEHRARDELLELHEFCARERGDGLEQEGGRLLEVARRQGVQALVNLKAVAPVSVGE